MTLILTLTLHLITLTLTPHLMRRGMLMRLQKSLRCSISFSGR